MTDSRERVMWRHYCPEEKAWISVGKGQPCNWCEQIEKEKA
jgi:hypothetical protein